MCFGDSKAGRGRVQLSEVFTNGVHKIQVAVKYRFNIVKWFPCGQ